MQDGYIAISSPETDEIYLYVESAGFTWTLSGVFAAPDAIADGRLGQSAVAVLPLDDGYPRVVASASGTSEGDAAAVPIVFLPSPFGATRAEPAAALPDSPSGLYGSALSVSPEAAFLLAIGDPGASGTGAAYVVSGATLPVGTDTAAPQAPAVSVHVFPTPTSRTATVRIAAAGPVEVGVFDLLGREAVRTRVVYGPQDLSIDASGLPSGVYAVHVSSATSATTARLTVAH